MSDARHPGLPPPSGRRTPASPPPPPVSPRPEPSGVPGVGSGAETAVATGPEGLHARRAAVAAVAAVLEDGAWSNLAVPRAVADLADPRDRAFATHLAHETVRWWRPLDAALGRVLDRGFDDVEPALRNVLRVGALQLLRPGGVPDHAAVDTAVRLAREAVPADRARGAGGFVNGVLRALARADDPLAPPADADDVTRLAAVTSHPRWVVRDLVAQHGIDRAEAVLHADNRNPGVTLRAAGERDALLAELRAAGVDASPGVVAATAVRAPGADPRTLAPVAEGRAAVQDEASQVVVAATGAAPDMRVLDLCAGPGGKTAALAERVDAAGGRGIVVAVEADARRAAMVRRTCERLGQPATVHVGDARDPAVLAAVAGGRPFDVVLVDAPCTGLGTGRRRPEVRWRRGPDDVAALAEVQRGLLAAAAPLVGPGGTLAYSVCTWTAGETTAVASALEDADAGLEATGRRQLLPDVDDTDGMFVATWRRRDA